MTIRPLFALAVFAVALPSVALADPTPQPSQTPPPQAPPTVPGLPSGITLPPSVINNPIVQSVLQTVTGAATRTLGMDPNWSQGRVTYFKRYEMQIETVPGKYREVHLHQGTVINPRGTTLATGMNVKVSGVHQSDGSLSANEITAGG